MPIALQDSETMQNLMRAFAGESQARSRYTLGAALCGRQQLHLLQSVFTLTANQEQEHAEIFYNHMGGVPAGKKLSIQADYPVDHTEDLCALLRQAGGYEFEEASQIYPAFARTAQQEGFPEIATSFEQIAKIEQSHGNRFVRYADLMEQGTLFTADSSCAWFCLNCGHIHEGDRAPESCPVCQHPQGFFIRLEAAPYGGASMLL